MVRPVDPERAAARRQQIMDAAGECFRTQGFQRTSMSAICAAAGLSPGAVYRYFPSKDALIGAIMQEHVSAIVDDSAPAATRLQALRNFARRVFCVDERGEDLRLTAEVFTEARRRPEFMRQLAITRTIAESALRGVIAAGQETGEFRASIDPGFAASSLVYFLDGLIFKAITTVEGDVLASDAIDIFERTAIAMLVQPDSTVVNKASSAPSAMPPGHLEVGAIA